MSSEDWNHFAQAFKSAPAKNQIKTIRHALRNYATTVSGYANLLNHRIDPLGLKGLPDDLPPQELGEWLKRLLEASQEIDKLIELLYDVDKIDR
jgi:signal transduction histidine kinase